MTATRMNLIGVKTLVAENDNFGADLLNSMLRSFGVSELTFVKTGQATCESLEKIVYDLLICAAMLSDMSGAELVKSVRRMNPPNRFMPILIMTTHAQMGIVRDIRDAGAHMIVKKPVSPAVLYDRIAWAATAPRPFIEAGAYTGPDRRFRSENPPEGNARRSDDSPAGDGGDAEPDPSERLAERPASN